MAEKKNNLPRKRRKKRRLKKGAIFFFLLFFLLIIFVALSLTVFFPVGAIRVQGESIYAEEQVIAASKIQKGDNMFLQMFNGSQSRIITALPYVHSVSYRYVLPDTLVISVTPFIACFQFKVQEQYVIAAEDGTVLEIRSEPQADLPAVVVNALEYKVRKRLQFGDTAREQIFSELQQSLKDYNISPGEIDLTDTLNIRLKVRKTAVELGSGTYLDKKLNMLNKMLQNVPEGEEGTVTLSAWTPENKKASYVKKADSE